ncbi:MAG: hypothetical protein ABI681_13815 [Gemmatimonadales bacterium]
MSPRPSRDASKSSEFAILGAADSDEGGPGRTADFVVTHASRPHFVLVAGLVFLALTLVGLIYDLWYFHYFGIDMLDYATTGDLFMSAPRHPVAVLLSILPGVLLLGLARLRDLRLRNSSARESYMRRNAGARWNKPAWRLGIYGLFVLAYAVLFSQFYAQRMSSLVKTAGGKRVVLTRTDGVTRGEQPSLIGATGKFFFLYYPERRVTEIVPVENTAIVTVDSRSRIERARDSAARPPGSRPKASISRIIDATEEL